MVQHNKQTSRRRQGQHGATMIELLVSLLIFAFGMLGLVGLQNKALGFGQMSLYRSQAAALSDDIMDRMRADRTNAKAGTWDTDFGTAASTYSGTTVAQKDLFEWKTQVESLLPTGQAKVDVRFDPATGFFTVTVNIQWNERRATPLDPLTSFVTVSRL